MSAGFKVSGEVFWGTNGAVEVYVETLAALAASRFAPDDPLRVYLEDERDGLYGGKILYLDEALTGPVTRARFLELLDAATDHVLRECAFTEYGREWVATVVAALRDKVAGGSPAELNAAPDRGGM